MGLNSKLTDNESDGLFSAPRPSLNDLKTEEAEQNNNQLSYSSNVCVFKTAIALTLSILGKTKPCTYHDSFTVSSKSILKQSGKDRVSVWNCEQTN